MKKTLLVIAAPLAASLVWFALPRAPTPPPPSPAPVRATGPDLAVHAEHAALRARLERLDERTASPAQLVAEEQPAEPAPVTEAPALSPQERRDAQAALLAATLGAEPSDAGWARAAEGELRARIASIPVDGATVTSVECRTTLCRLEIDFRSTGTRDGGLRDVSRWVPWDFDGFYHPADSDPRRLMLYLSR